MIINQKRYDELKAQPLPQLLPPVARMAVTKSWVLAKTEAPSYFRTLYVRYEDRLRGLGLAGSRDEALPDAHDVERELLWLANVRPDAVVNGHAYDLFEEFEKILAQIEDAKASVAPDKHLASANFFRRAVAEVIRSIRTTRRHAK